MSQIYIKYETINQLVEAFQKLDPVKLPRDENSNFVLIDPRLYEGSYGGLVFDAILDRYSKSKDSAPFVASSIGHGVSVLWWSTPEPSFTGDVFALSVENRVGVTRDMYDRLYPSVFYRNNHPQVDITGKKLGPCTLHLVDMILRNNVLLRIRLWTLLVSCWM